MKLAIIGMGIMGCRYAKMILDGLVKGIEITAVTRISPERKEALKDLFDQGTKIYQTADALLEAVENKNTEADAVLIVTPHLSHAEIAVKAMNMGLHVLCDKPAGVYSRQAHGAAPGKVREEAFCNEGKYHDIAVEDEVTAYFTFENGATGTFYSTTGEASNINRLEISMEDALLVWEKEKIMVRELKVHEAEYRKTAADGKETLFVEGAEGCKSLLLANAMYLFSWKKQMVNLPQNTEEKIAFEQAYEKEFSNKR